MIAFVNTSYVGDLLLKVLMCGLPEYQSGRGLTPFWKTDPYSACKRQFLFFYPMLLYVLFGEYVPVPEFFIV